MIEKFCVGYAKVDITPAESVPLVGIGNPKQRLSDEVLDPLYMVCTAFSDEEGNRLLYYTVDLCRSDHAAALIRESASEATGVAQDRIMCNASHTHSGPCLYVTDMPVIAAYHESLRKWAVQAAQEALADLKPAKMYIGAVPVIGQTFLRHYLLPDGTKVGYDGMARHNNPVDHVGVADRTMQLVKFSRQEAKDVLLVNFQCHNSRALRMNRYGISADVAGVIRAALEKDLDCHAAYVNGASGNTNFTSLIQAEKHSKTYLEQGKEIADVVISSAEHIFTPVQTGRIQVVSRCYCGEVNHREDHIVPQAEMVRQVWQTTNSLAEAAAAGAPYGIRSPFHANAIVSHSKLPSHKDIPIYAISIGDVAFVTAPYEMFALSGLRIKEGAPFKMTLISAYTNGHLGYMPVEEVFAYESYEGSTTNFVPGTAEVLEKELISMLNELYLT